ncbi:hypothetical protein BH09ACT11_BH09ACT11_12290 [soil metagenome]
MGASSDYPRPSGSTGSARPRRAGWAAALALGMATLAPALGGGNPPDRATLTGASARTAQTSDGEPGPAPRVTRPWMSKPITFGIKRKHLAPGVDYVTWDTVDARGPVRFHLVTADLDVRGVRVDYAAPGKVARTTQLSRLYRRDGAVAGVNGDFFDIGDTSAPLGTGIDRHAGLRHGRAYGWNSTFWIDSRGRPQIGVLPVTVTSRQLGGVAIKNLNSPFVYPDSVGLWTGRWGELKGTSMTDGPITDSKVIRIRKGTVVSVGRTVPASGKLAGKLLVGRGKVGVGALKGIQVGDMLRFRTSVASNPKIAISGQSLLIDDGLVVATDDSEMHPRTAVAINHDTAQIMLLVIDGRQSFSRGYTLREMARKLVELGADEAINLDGGGSSFMYLNSATAKPRIANSPSDGVERHVANGLEIHARG